MYVSCIFCCSDVDPDTGYCSICKSFDGAITEELLDEHSGQRGAIDQYKADRELKEVK